MTILEKYYSELDARAAQERESAAEAKTQGDEREHSIRLMRSSMLGDMLKALGRVQHEGKRPTVLADQIAALGREEEKLRALEDFDAADRAHTKAQTIAWALDTLKKLEAEHE